MNKKEVRELMRQFPYITEYGIINARRECKRDSTFMNRLDRENKARELELTAADVEQIIIHINWYTNRNGEYCPATNAEIKYFSGCYELFRTSASGCGYDKESTVMANIFNKFCKNKLWEKRRTRKEVPYGANLDAKTRMCYFSGGVGIECYRRIIEFLGGQYDHVAWSKNYDKYVFTFKPIKR